MYGDIGCMNALENANTPGQLFRAVQTLHALPGMGSTVFPEIEGLLLAVHEQRELSNLDGVDVDTGLANRRQMHLRIREIEHGSLAVTEQIALVIFRFPVASSRSPIVAASRICSRSLRPDDFAVRLDPRRLGVLLRDVSRPGALAVAERLRLELARRQLGLENSCVSIHVIDRDYARRSPRKRLDHATRVA